MVQDALNVLLRVVTEGIGHGGDADQATFGGAGFKFLIFPGAPVGPQGVGGVVAEDPRRPGEFDGVHRSGRGGVGQVDSHSQVVHPVDGFDAELAQPAGVAFVQAVADEVLPVVGDARETHAHGVELVQTYQAVADGQVLQLRHESDLAGLLRRQNLVCVAHPDHVLLG